MTLKLKILKKQQNGPKTRLFNFLQSKCLIILPFQQCVFMHVKMVSFMNKQIRWSFAWDRVVRSLSNKTISHHVPLGRGGLSFFYPIINYKLPTIVGIL